MAKDNHIYIAIDLKSFYASVECVERKLNPLNTNLVVADQSRTEKTICLAVSAPLKTFGIPGRPRLFQVVQRVKEINAFRSVRVNKFQGESYFLDELEKNKSLKVAYIVATPRMALYMDYSTRIYNVYLRYIAPEDIHVYSIDEVFLDVTHYLKTYNMTCEQLAKTIIQDILKTTGITATAGIGTNMYLCKVAMDIVAKHIEPDKDNVRVAYLDEMTYRRLLWKHRPLTDFWRVGAGYAKKLEQVGLYTMGDIARCSVGRDNEYYNEDLLYKLFGVNAELLIDHAWGYEPCTIEDIKKYHSKDKSFGAGQVLACAYSKTEARVVVAEMVDQIALDMFEKNLVANQLVLTVGYDLKSNISGDKHTHGTANLEEYTWSSIKFTKAVLDLYDKIVDAKIPIRRINIAANHVVEKQAGMEKNQYRQISLFDNILDNSLSQNINYGGEQKTNYSAGRSNRYSEMQMEKEEKIQEAVLQVKNKYGKNSVLKGISFNDKATARQRNNQIGGHKA